MSFIIRVTFGCVLLCSFFTESVGCQELSPLFDGESLKGWKVPDGNIWWAANQGILSVKSGPNKKGSNLWTEKQYENFVMQLEFKMGEGTVDSGVFLRSEKDQIQIGISGSLKVDMTGSPYIPGKGYPVKAEVKEVLEVKDWNRMTIIAKGKSYNVWLNDKFVMHFVSESMKEKGPIGLQLHGNREMSIEFRDLSIGELK